MDIKVEEAPEKVVPKCPHCQQKLDRIWIWRKGLRVVQQRQLIMCPHCEVLLGYGVFST